MEGSISRLLIGILIFTSVFVGVATVYFDFGSAYSFETTSAGDTDMGETSSLLADIQEDLAGTEKDTGVDDISWGALGSLKRFASSLDIFAKTVQNEFAQALHLPAWATNLIIGVISALITFGVISAILKRWV